MIIKNTYDYHGTPITIEYHDADEFDNLDYAKCRQVYAVCMYKNKMIIVHNGNKDTWGLVGGSIEPGETFEQTLRRELKEEANLQVLKFRPVGYQYAFKDDIYELRYVCQVEPYGEFESDPAGVIDKITHINPTDVKKYFDWGPVGDRIIERAQLLLQ